MKCFGNFLSVLPQSGSHTSQDFLILTYCTKEICYDNEPWTLGWCGVCNHKALKGHEGYCDTEVNLNWGQKMNEENLKEATKTTPQLNWGWCSNECWARQYSKTSLARFLQVAHVHVIESNICVSILQNIDVLRHLYL